MKNPNAQLDTLAFGIYMISIDKTVFSFINVEIIPSCIQELCKLIF